MVRLATSVIVLAIDSVIVSGFAAQGPGVANGTAGRWLKAW